MAEEVSPNNPDAVAQVTKTDVMAQESITIGQFWDQNPLIMPWMGEYLPRNPMWKDGTFILYNCVFSIVIIVLFSNVLILPDKLVLVPAIILIVFDSYLLAAFNTRMARAQGKFIRAKLHARPFSERIRSGVQGIKEWLNP
ncbi:MULTISPECIES: hypothetical protein [unclassified Mesorhizobium]|uniref:hypothetical protein n=1 Tax=unclassified Mesorhizobium TaxID=325217 RepID=UPI000FDCC76D|nr:MULTISPECIES: hypothetical protein [unclassified Mesorhizobium]TGQ04925.1 hypothetical protein EN862_032095 [Mesorhizobium sp. M2E.F.Ca.ET.219.01.1.1]TGT65633.1 hypothetical protein EN809_032930 [Mesorhizobium sp. M2E.F.Ca.ET.166.01.1.1]TGV97678.1 hypothetical protein EN797_032940 [Mesorhizobium sp. M2E.F.Ca.ET.154.01.1.1]